MLCYVMCLIPVLHKNSPTILHVRGVDVKQYSKSHLEYSSTKITKITNINYY